MGNQSSRAHDRRSSPSFVLQRKAGADQKYRRSKTWDDEETEDAVSQDLASRPIQWENASSVAAHSRINLLENVRSFLSSLKRADCWMPMPHADASRVSCWACERGPACCGWGSVLCILARDCFLLGRKELRKRLAASSETRGLAPFGFPEKGALSPAHRSLSFRGALC